MTKPKEPAIFSLIDREAYEKLTPAQRTEMAPLLAEAAELFERNPLLTYHPHPKQIPFHKSRNRIKAFFGGNRSGKSTAGLVDDLIQAVDRKALPPHLIPYKRWEPPFKCRIVSPDFTSTMEGVIFEKLREWAPKDQLLDGSWAKAYDKQRRVLRFANGSWFDFLTSEQDIDKFSGADLHRVHFDEEPPGEKGFQIFRECSMRLIDHGGDMVFSMTPLFGLCVDTETECLTKRGWKKHSELVDGDLILTYSLDGCVTEWAPLLGVYRDPDYRGEMVRQTGRRRIDGYFTPEHKWVTERGLVPFSEMTTKDTVVLSAPHRNLNQDVFSPDVLELAGWILAEGSVLPNENKVVIYQSATRYPQHCERIKELLDRVEAQYHTGDRFYDHSKGKGVIRRFVVTGDFARWVRFVLGYPKALRPELVASLGVPGAKALLKGLLDGDGHHFGNGTWHFTTVDATLADSVAMLGLITGERVRISSFKNAASTTVHRVHTQSTGQTLQAFKRHTEPAPPPEDGVWCPMTPNKTFVARRGGKVYITGNSWVYDQVWEQRGPEVASGVYQSEADGGITIVTVDMDDNPHLNAEAKKIALQGLSGPELKARKEGRFVHFAGLVYDEFTPEAHVVGEPDRSHIKGQDVLVGIDPGIKTTAILFAAFDGDNDMLIFDEIILGEESAIPENAARLIREKEAEWGVTPIYYVIDPAARHRSLVNAEQVATAYMRAGINTVPGQNAVEPGIFEVKRRLERTTKGAGAGLYISKACSRLIWEFGRYRMDPKAEGFAVVKKDDHALDVARYLAMSRPVAPHTLPSPRSHQTHWRPGQAPPHYAGAGLTPVHPFGDSF